MKWLHELWHTPVSALSTATRCFGVKRNCSEIFWGKPDVIGRQPGKRIWTPEAKIVTSTYQPAMYRTVPPPLFTTYGILFASMLCNTQSEFDRKENWRMPNINHVGDLCLRFGGTIFKSTVWECGGISESVSNTLQEQEQDFCDLAWARFDLDPNIFKQSDYFRVFIQDFPFTFSDSLINKLKQTKFKSK